jgi:LPS sulfotransferase NodH
MKGYLLLTEARSGSEWLGSLANNTGRMGISEEWIDSHFLGVKLRDLSGDDFFSLVLARSRTENDRFAVKVFPRHLYLASDIYGFDFVDRCMKERDTKLIFLRRNDRVRQAVSFARGLMTRQWRSDSVAKRMAAYDFPTICRCYFRIEQSYSFWQHYLGLRSLPHESVVYEDLLADPSAYLRMLSEHLDVETPMKPQTTLAIQRDDSTEAWVEKFNQDALSRNIVEFVVDRRYAPNRNLANLGRFLRKEPMIPLPFHAVL